MVNVVRSKANPLLSPDPGRQWEADSVFNASVIRDATRYHMVYRAVSGEQNIAGTNIKLSSVGYASSRDAVHWEGRRQIIAPLEDWEKYGVEDPRITKMGDFYYIFYTAISTFPPSAPGIRVAVAKTRDFSRIDERHLVTFFNAKAMTMFPAKIKGKYCVFLTVHTDMPPAYICCAYVDEEKDLWNEKFWADWYENVRGAVVPFYKTPKDQVEVGATPILTDRGWLMIYCHIQNYFSTPKLFRIDAALLDGDDPKVVLGQTSEPVIVPEEDYEIYGAVPNVIFPSGAIIKDDDVYVYYGGADTRVCMAQMKLKELTSHIHGPGVMLAGADSPKLVRYAKNPIISPQSGLPWKNKSAFNPGAVHLNGQVHILYRAMNNDGVSVLGYASSTDGSKLSQLSPEPAYVPRELFEKRFAGGDSGCEDPRLTLLEGTVYMLYTAYDGTHPPRVATTSITQTDFACQAWSKWKKPQLISPPGIDDKDACVFPEKINGKYAFFHRLVPSIWLDFSDTLEFTRDRWLGGHPILFPRPNSWDSDRIGIGPPPVKTAKGWLLIYHGLSKYDKKYRLGAVLLDLENPAKVVSRFNDPILEPEAPYETEGLRPNTVFANGAVVLGGELLVYYGGGDTVSAVASIKLDTFLSAILKGH